MHLHYSLSLGGRGRIFRTSFKHHVCQVPNPRRRCWRYFHGTNCSYMMLWVPISVPDTILHNCTVPFSFSRLLVLQPLKCSHLLLPFSSPTPHWVLELFWDLSFSIIWSLLQVLFFTPRVVPSKLNLDSSDVKLSFTLLLLVLWSFVCHPTPQNQLAIISCRRTSRTLSMMTMEDTSVWCGGSPSCWSSVTYCMHLYVDSTKSWSLCSALSK